jgi:AsmA protein
MDDGITSNKIKSHSIFKTLFKISALLALFFIVLIIIAATLFYLFKDDISKKLLLSLNEIQKGEIILEDISFEPFAQFPSISIGINNIIYFENKEKDRDSLEKPIGKLDVIYVAFDVVELIGGRINISKVSIDGGIFNFITYKDSTVNLFNAFGVEKPAVISEEKNLVQEKITDQNDQKPKKKKLYERDKNSDIDLSVEDLNFANLKFNFENLINNRKSTYNINNLYAALDHKPDLITGYLSANIIIDSLQLSDESFLKEQTLDVDTKFSIDITNLLINVNPSHLSFANAEFDFKGYYDIKNDEYIDFEIDGSDHDFSFFSLVLSDKGMAHLESGDFYFRGTVRGKTLFEIPIIELSFGVNDVNIFIPEVNKRINDLKFSAYFNSGSKKDLSGANLKIDNLTAKLPDGYLNGSFYISNFAFPYLDLKWNMKTSLNGFDDMFKVDFVNNLAGSIEITDTVKGYYNADLQRIEADDNRSTIICKDLSFNLPGILEVQKFDGTIKRNLDQYELEALKIIAGDTDLLINGKINNIHYLIFNEEKKIDSNLKIKSILFDLPNFLAFDPTIGRDFPYRIKNIDLVVGASTTTNKVLSFKSFPEIDFIIEHLDATAENFLPPLTIRSGVFKISENILGFHMDFDDFKTDFVGGNLNFTADYNSSKHQPFYIKADFDMTKINPGKLFYDEDQDTIPDFLNGSLNGSLLIEVQFPTDTMAIKLLNLEKGNLNYYFADDTIQTSSFKLFAEDIYFNEETNPNPFASLTTDILFEVNELYTNHFKVTDIHYGINANNGTYTVIPKKKSFFGSEGQGMHILKPFYEEPNYRFQYSINQFNAEDLLETFLEDTMLTGKMDFSMDITMSGNEWDSLVSKLNGDIHLAGNDLILYGVDTDDLLEKFKRSQRFTLVDVGAVLLAGPVGIAVTKGTDYASLIVLDSGEETNVTNLVSDWSISDGTLIVQDVAFTTEKNRIAANGWLNFPTDSLYLTIALLNKHGCSIFSQDLYGSLDEPQKGEIKVVGTILAPVTNLVDDIFGADCEVFYDGTITHPNK